MVRKRTWSGVTFDIFNTLFLILLCVSTLYPFLYLLSTSLASNNVALSTMGLIPSEITLDNFRRVVQNDEIGSAYVVTIVRTVCGTLLSLIFTFTGAYVLSKKYYPHRNFWTAVVVFTMFFDGGMIPTYLLVKSLKLTNTIWCMILPGLISAYNLVIARNYFMSLPDSFEESARIDGANDIRILVSIILPLCKPIIATIALWLAVDHWNAWFDCMLYTTEARWQVVQLIMRRIVLEGSAQYVDLNTVMNDSNAIITPESVKAATIMVTTLPILAVYPFIQKYFVKGVMVGSLKG